MTPVLPAPAPSIRPRLRGVSHLIAFFACGPALLWLVSSAPTREARTCAAVYALSLLTMLGTSAVYHRQTWRPAAWARMRGLDHSAVFLLIAGTYTPICWLGVGGVRGTLLLPAVWMGAALGIAQTLFWRSAPRWLHVGIYVLLGWVGIFGLPAESASIGTMGMLLHLLGGILYTMGAVIYARQRPDPFPAVFGYHEIFHLFVLAACACLFEVVRRCLLVPVPI